MVGVNWLHIHCMYLLKSLSQGSAYVLCIYSAITNVSPFVDPAWDPCCTVSWALVRSTSCWPAWRAICA